jgi:hypothetical protein
MVGLRFGVFIFDEFNPRTPDIHHRQFKVCPLLVDSPFRPE